MIPIKTGLALPDHETRLLIDAYSLTQMAVDRRIKRAVVALVEAALSDSEVVRKAALEALNWVLEHLGVSTPSVKVDTDGVLYMDPGERTQKVVLDTDGVPAVI